MAASSPPKPPSMPPGLTPAEQEAWLGISVESDMEPGEGGSRCRCPRGADRGDAPTTMSDRRRRSKLTTGVGSGHGEEGTEYGRVLGQRAATLDAEGAHARGAGVVAQHSGGDRQLAGRGRGEHPAAVEQPVDVAEHGARLP